MYTCETQAGSPRQVVPMSQQVIAITLQVLELKHDNSSQIKRYFVATTIRYPLNAER